MTTQELIEALDQQYGNPNAKGLELIQEAIEHLRKYEAMFKATGVTLTDKEILESFAFYFGSTLNNKAYNDGAILFAKDILRKAQEK
jgi:hypothetical protein